VRLVAHHVGAEVHAGSPRVSAELPETGERFEGLLPPVVAAPAFAIRKPPSPCSRSTITSVPGSCAAQAEALRAGVASRANILVAGGTSTGKTTLTNALLAEVAKTSDRVVIIEDTRELQCAAPNLVAMRTKDGVASLSDLVRSSLRLRPDRIPIGEVRGAEALDLLKAWGTGHPGGVGTIHAGSAIGALRRMEQLIQEAVVTVPRALIAETIDLVAVLSGRGSARRLTELARVEGLARTAITASRPPSSRATALRLPQPKPSAPKETINDPTSARHLADRRPQSLHHLTMTASVAVVSLMMAAPAHASGSSMPWEAPLQSILQSIEGPVAKIIAVIIIITTGLTLAFGDTSGGFRRLIQIVFGLSIAFAASSFFLSFFSFGGGALV
jgi:type IV secretion system protein VirB11